MTDTTPEVVEHLPIGAALAPPTLPSAPTGGGAAERRARRWVPSVATTVVVLAVLICLAMVLAVHLGARTVPGPDLPLPR